MGRLKPELLERAEGFCDRCLDVVDVLEKRQVSRRFLSVDRFCDGVCGEPGNQTRHSVGRFLQYRWVSIKELNETKFWIRLVLVAVGSADRLGALSTRRIS